MKTTLQSIATFLLLLGIIFQFNSCTEGTPTIRHGCVCYEDNYGFAEKTISVSPTFIENFYSTDEESGKITADGACHAYMVLTFRWNDDELAKTDIKPPLAYEFQSLLGYFPTNLGMETKSTSSDGINEYTISISEAADAENPKADRYSIWVKYVKGVTAEQGAITCNISIQYRVYNELFYEEGCEMFD